MRTPSRKTKPKKKASKASQPAPLKGLLASTVKLWRKSHLTDDQARYVAKEARAALSITRVRTHKRVVARLSRDEEQRLIQQAYKDKGAHGLLIKTLFQTGARVSGRAPSGSSLSTSQ